MRYALFLVLFLSNVLQAQNSDIRIYLWSEVINANPDTIFGISFSKQKIAIVPEELQRFKNLQHLDLGKNKLNNLPDFMGDMTNLTYLDISKNEFSNFPIEICRLSNLKTLIANRNDFSNLPECIGFLEKLEKLDLWDTPIMDFPESLTKLTKLKTIDLQGVKYGPTFQKKFKESLPWVEILMDPPCDCME